MEGLFISARLHGVLRENMELKMRQGFRKSEIIRLALRDYFGLKTAVAE